MEIQYLTFDLGLGIKLTQDVTQCLLHHLTYASAKFKVAMSYGLEDAFSKMSDYSIDL